MGNKQLTKIGLESRGDLKFLKVTRLLAEESKCVSQSVAVIAVKEGRIVATGINGSPPGAPNCCEVFPLGKSDKHHEWSLTHEIHAEANMILSAARMGNVGLEGCVVYCSLQPCSACSLLLAALKPSRVVYGKPYDREKKIGPDHPILSAGIPFIYSPEEK